MTFRLEMAVLFFVATTVQGMDNRKIPSLMCLVSAHILQSNTRDESFVFIKNIPGLEAILIANHLLSVVESDADHAWRNAQALQQNIKLNRDVNPTKLAVFLQELGDAGESSSDEKLIQVVDILKLCKIHSIKPVPTSYREKPPSIHMELHMSS